MNTSSKIAWLLLVVALIAGGFAVYYHQKYIQALENTPQGAANQTQAVVAKVGQLIVLPQNETPTVATVVDPTALQSQPFFENATKGDIVLIYTNAREAILYDPSANKIVAVAPLTTTSAQQAVAPAVIATTTAATPTSSSPSRK